MLCAEFAIRGTQEICERFQDVIECYIMNYRKVNREGWDRLVRNGCKYAQPFGRAELKRAKKLLDPDRWINWKSTRKVLCLASGGGQQGPLFASLGCDVTVFDLSPEQLQKDRESAEKFGLKMTLLAGDMLNLKKLHGAKFDLVYQPVSAGYIPDVQKLYREVTKVLKRGGRYLVEHWSALQLQLPETDEWDGHAYRIVLPQTAGARTVQTRWNIGTNTIESQTWHYIHPMDHLIGGLCRAGFTISQFSEPSMGDPNAEPGSEKHLYAYLPPMCRIFAQL